SLPLTMSCHRWLVRRAPALALLLAVCALFLRSLRCQLFASACYVGGGLGGAALGGTSGSAWGVAAATISGSAVWWLQLRSALRERHRDPIPEVRTS
ncbi:hypothetical protein ABT050_45165, partial [Streptomyces mirabilis]